MWYNKGRDLRNSSSLKGGRKLRETGSRSDEALRRDILKAVEVLARDSEILAGRGVDPWGDPRLRRFVKRAIASRGVLKRALVEEQMVLPGFANDEAGHKLRKLQSAVRCGVAQKMFPVGNVIADTWTDVVEDVAYDAPWIVVSYRDVMLTCGEIRPGAVLLRKMTVPFKVQFDAADAVYVYGNNCIDLSDLFVWLNSDARQPNWWFTQHDSDEEPDYARKKAGYLAGCSPALREVASEIMLDAIVMDGGIRVHGKTACKMFMPSVEELNIDVTGQNSLYVGRVWEYFRDTVQHPDYYCAKRIFRDNDGKPQRCWTRSPKGPHDSWLWMIAQDGDVDFSSACTEYSVIVACVVA